MAVRTGFSIALLMLIVFLVAADLAIVSAIGDGPGPAFVVALTTLPMINILLLAFPRLRRREASSYWLAFEVFGWPVVLLVALAGWFEADAFFSPIFWVGQLLPFEHGTVPSFAFLISFAVVFYTIPQMLAALIGGWLSTRYRIVIERRR